LKLKLEKSMLSKTSHLQLNQIASLKRQHYEYEARVSDMQYSMRRMNQDRLQKEEELDEVPKLVTEIEDFKGKYEKSMGDAEKWKNKFEKLSKTHVEYQKKSVAYDAFQERMNMSGSLSVPSGMPLGGSVTQSMDGSIMGRSITSTTGFNQTSSGLSVPISPAPVPIDFTPIWSSKHPSQATKMTIRKSKSANGGKLKPLQPSKSAPRMGMGVSVDDRFNFY